MVKGTTPTIICTLPETVDLTAAENVYFSLQQGANIITKTGNSLDVSAHEVSVYFSQEETLSLSPGTARVQLNWTYANNSRACSNIVEISVTNNLILEVLA